MAFSVEHWQSIGFSSDTSLGPADLLEILRLRGDFEDIRIRLGEQRWRRPHLGCHGHPDPRWRDSNHSDDWSDGSHRAKAAARSIHHKLDEVATRPNISQYITFGVGPAGAAVIAGLLLDHLLAALVLAVLPTHPSASRRVGPPEASAPDFLAGLEVEGVGEPARWRRARSTVQSTR
jgi:hypothetical protein